MQRDKKMKYMKALCCMFYLVLIFSNKICYYAFSEETQPTYMSYIGMSKTKFIVGSSETAEISLHISGSGNIKNGFFSLSSGVNVLDGSTLSVSLSFYDIEKNTMDFENFLLSPEDMGAVRMITHSIPSIYYEGAFHIEIVGKINFILSEDLGIGKYRIDFSFVFWDDFGVAYQLTDIVNYEVVDVWEYYQVLIPIFFTVLSIITSSIISIYIKKKR